MDNEIRIANAVYVAVAAIFTAAMLSGAALLPQSFFA